MSVYVDPLVACLTSPQWRWPKACHMVADTLDELHAFAAQIGLRREWFQDRRLPHYDLNWFRRDCAVRQGAIELSRREFVERFVRPAKKKAT